nr:MAG TPA: hypothetical protein [Caudoviricetes sp.]
MAGVSQPLFLVFKHFINNFLVKGAEYNEIQ